MTLSLGSLFAGIGGFDLGFHRAGMTCAWQVEIDSAARSVLTCHWPAVPKYADIRDCGARNLAPVDVLCGGFPCQDLSVAGRREGLTGARSGLFYEMTRITDELRPAFLVWENVPGLLSSGAGRDFLAVLIELDRIGYVGGWRTLDAQYFGVAQRRRRIFGVFARRDIGAAVCAEILALATGMSGHPAPCRTEGTNVAASLTAGTSASSGVNRPGRRREDDYNLVMPAIAQSNRGGDTGDVAETLRSDCNGALPMVGYSTSGQGWWRSGIGPEAARSHKDAENGVVVCGALSAAQGGPDDDSAQAGHVIAVKGAANGRAPENGPQYGEVLDDGTCYTLNCTEVHAVLPSVVPTLGKESYSPTKSSSGQMVDFCITQPVGVRRLTPVECERLQGFPDDFTAGQGDSTRYRQLGNAVAVPVAEWIGRRIVETSQ